MARRALIRRTLRDRKIATNAGLAVWSAISGKPTPAHLIHEVKPLRKRTTLRKPSGQRLEKHVLADVLKALRRDPRVAQVERTQSGLFQEGNRFIRVGTPGKLDITGLLVGGRYFEIEVKRPGGKPDERQAARIASIKTNGGISGYATSAEEALALLP